MRAWTHSHLWHEWFICVTWLPCMYINTTLHMRDMNHTCDMNDSCHTYGSWVTSWMGHVTHLKLSHHTYEIIISLHEIFMSNTWNRHVTHMKSSRHTCGSCHHVIFATGLIHICDMTHSYVWQDSFMCVTWMIYMCSMNHMCDMNQSCHTYKIIMWHIWNRHVTHMGEIVMSHTWNRHVTHMGPVIM